jgi:hypothetical protein
MPLKDPEARRAYRQRRKVLFPETILEQNAKSREKHRAKIRLKDAARREANREKIRAADRAAYAANPEPKKASARRYEQTHKEALAPGKKRRCRQRHTRQQSLPDTWTATQEAFMLTYWQHSCAVCGQQAGLLWILAFDHWIPLSHPSCPGTIATNMLPLCHGITGCNNSKHARLPHPWLIQKFGKRKTAKIEKAIAAYFAAVNVAFPLVS